MPPIHEPPGLVSRIRPPCGPEPATVDRPNLHVHGIATVVGAPRDGDACNRDSKTTMDKDQSRSSGHNGCGSIYFALGRHPCRTWRVATTTAPSRPFRPWATRLQPRWSKRLTEEDQKDQLHASAIGFNAVRAPSISKDADTGPTPGISVCKIRRDSPTSLRNSRIGSRENVARPLCDTLQVSVLAASVPTRTVRDRLLGLEKSPSTKYPPHTIYGDYIR